MTDEQTPKGSEVVETIGGLPITRTRCWSSGGVHVEVQLDALVQIQIALALAVSWLEGGTDAQIVAGGLKELLDGPLLTKAAAAHAEQKEAS